MSDLENIKIEQIRAETQNIKKQTEKIEEEIKDLRGKKPYNYRNFIWWRDRVGILTVVASLVYGVWNFIDQQREKNKFLVTREVVTLVQQLSEGSEQVQSNTAILLAAYGEHVLPNLLNALTVSDSPGLLTALSLIAQREPEAVSQPLIKRAVSDIGSVLQGDKHKILSFKNYIKALGEIGSLGDTQPAITAMQGFQEKLDCEQLIKQGTFTLDILDRRVICEEIANACDKIRPGACKK